MPVVSEDTNGLLRLVEEDHDLHEACLSAAIAALRSNWRYQLGLWRDPRRASLTTAKAIHEVRSLIEASTSEAIAGYLTEASPDFRDAAREFIAEVVANPGATAAEIACAESPRVADSPSTSSPTSPMAKAKSKETSQTAESSGGPEKTIRLGNISASVFLNQGENSRAFRNVVFQRSYRADSGDRQYSQSFSVSDLPALERVLKRTQDYVEQIEVVIDESSET